MAAPPGVRHLGSTPPFPGPDGKPVANSVAEIRTYRLGGLEQWVMVRSRNVANPVLIMLHGGPGFPETRLFRTFNASLEDHFTVVYWEQRGTGKSFDPATPKPSMTVAQFITDLDGLVDAMRQRFGKEKVAILGHSWGSALGVLYAARFPQKVCAYVGAGQVGNWAASETICYDNLVKESQRRGHRRALQQLRAIGPPPHDGQQQMIQGKWLTQFYGMVRGMSLWRLSAILLKPPEASPLDLPNILRGTVFSTHAMWEEVSALNLMTAAPALAMPVFFFIGRYDPVIAPKTSVTYFEMLAAPSKKLIWFEASAHAPAFEEPEKFNAAMVQLVRPATIVAAQP